jgi:hypothetical protein
MPEAMMDSGINATPGMVYPKDVRSDTNTASCRFIDGVPLFSWGWGWWGGW